MDTQQQSEASALTGYMTLTEWVDRHAGPFFRTRAAAAWFVKQHHQELIEADSLIPGRGRAGSLVHTEKFSKQVVAIRRREALTRAA